MSIKDIVDDIFTTYSVRKRRKDIVAFYCQKFQADLFDEENGDLTASEDIIAKRIDTILKEDKLSPDPYLKSENSKYWKTRRLKEKIHQLIPQHFPIAIIPERAVSVWLWVNCCLEVTM